MWDAHEEEFCPVCPVAAGVLASFPKWSRTMGGILASAGIEGFLGNLERLHADAAVDVSERGEFLAQWHARQYGRAHTLSELCKAWVPPAGLLGGYVGTQVDGSQIPVPAVELPLELRGFDSLRFEKVLGNWLGITRMR